MGATRRRGRRGDGLVVGLAVELADDGHVDVAVATADLAVAILGGRLADGKAVPLALEAAGTSCFSRAASPQPPPWT